MSEAKVDVVKLYNRDNDVSINPQGSRIIDFFNGKNVFLTGGTGFLGKLLVEKLLRACENIGTIFLIVRAKKGERVKKRIDDYFEDKVFDQMKKLRPNYKSKILGIEGDISELSLGMSNSDVQLLCDQVDVVFHAGATTRFNEKLKISTYINIRGTHELLKLAKNFKNLKSFVHISTAYSFCVNNVIDEVFYEPPIDPFQLMALVDNVQESLVDELTPKLVGKWPNTYSFTKATAEDLVRRFEAELPICITRPAIVTSTWKEPRISWLNNVFGPTYIVVGAMAGQIKIAHANKHKYTDMVPGDYCINNIIAAAYKTATVQSKKAPIYNIASDQKNRLNYRDFISLVIKNGEQVPPTSKIWASMLIQIPSKFWFDFWSFLFHSIPALIVDLFIPTSESRKRTLYDISKKIHFYSMSISYFSLRDWTFINKNNRELWEGLGEEDRRAFPFSMKDFDWVTYCQTFGAGLREFIFKDDWETLPQSLKKRDRLLVIHRLTTAILGGLLFLFLYKLLMFLIL